MIEKTVTLVLGAGASAPYGFPSGAELVKMIVDTKTPAPERLNLLAKANLMTGIADFRDALRQSGADSIDAFLAGDPDYKPIGKMAIALLISQFEVDSKLHTDPRLEKDLAGENWYSYLFNFILVPENYFRDNDQTRQLPRINFATFNYDRSLEFFLYRAIERISADPTAAQNLYDQRVAVVHFHGQLQLPKFSEGALYKGRPYHPIDNIDTLHLASQGISLADEPGNQAALEQWEKLKADSDSIVFLCFGFAESNLRKLALAKNRKQGSMVYATSYGFTDSEFRYRAGRVEPDLLNAAKATVESRYKARDFLRNHHEIFFNPIARPE